MQTPRDRKLSGCLGPGVGQWEKGITKKWEENFGDDVYIHYFDCGDVFMVVCKCGTYQIVHFENVQFIVSITS